MLLLLDTAGSLLACIKRMNKQGLLFRTLQFSSALTVLGALTVPVCGGFDIDTGSAQIPQARASPNFHTFARHDTFLYSDSLQLLKDLQESTLIKEFNFNFIYFYVFKKCFFFFLRNG